MNDYPEEVKHAARNTLQLSINKGDIPHAPSQECFACGTRDVFNHHHHLDYAYPYYTVILCASHHRLLHVLLKRGLDNDEALDMLKRGEWITFPKVYESPLNRHRQTWLA